MASDSVNDYDNDDMSIDNDDYYCAAKSSYDDVFGTSSPHVSSPSSDIVQAPVVKSKSDTAARPGTPETELLCTSVETLSSWPPEDNDDDIPSVDSDDIIISDDDTIPDFFFETDEVATTLNDATPKDDMKNQGVDSALAWSALSLLLVTPASASMMKKSSSRKENAKLWELEAGLEDEDDIPELGCVGDATANNEEEGVHPIPIADSYCTQAEEKQCEEMDDLSVKFVTLVSIDRL